MHEGDLDRLSDVDFELVSKDLVEEILDVRLEVFASGADRGIDLRGVVKGRSIIVQCKHWRRSPRSALIRHIERVEAPKIRVLQPDLYVLLTSCDLTVDAKEKLLALLQPYVPSPGYIFGAREVAAELRKRPHIVQRHPRLWFQSASVLSTLLNKELFERNRDTAADIAESLRTFVPGRAYPQALRVLEMHHVCLLSGLPGYGKTTLAHALLATYAQRGFEIVDVSDGVGAIDRLWNDDCAQVYFFDDFLGRTFVDPRRTGSHRLLRLMKRIAESRDKRLVLTTREYVLAQARQQDDLLHRANLATVKCLVTVGEYDRTTRSAIVRNHVTRSPLPEQLKRTALSDRVVYWVANHSNFNPRFVTAVIASVSNNLVAPDTLVEMLTQRLSDPSDVWWHIVENQLDDASVDLLAVSTMFRFAAPVDEVESTWAAYRRVVGRSADSRLFRRAVRTTLGTLLRSGRGGDCVWLELHDGSVYDFAARYFARQVDVLRALLESGETFDQVDGVYAMVRRLAATPAATGAALAAAACRTFPDIKLLPDDGARGDVLWTVAEILLLHESPELRKLLRQSLLHVKFLFDDYMTDLSCAPLVRTMINDYARFTEELDMLLGPAIPLIEGTSRVLEGLLAFFENEPDVPAHFIADAAAVVVQAVQDQDVQNRAGEYLVWRLAEWATAQGETVPTIPGIWPAGTPQEESDVLFDDYFIDCDAEDAADVMPPKD